jgi:hypothetical protein
MLNFDVLDVVQRWFSGAKQGLLKAGLEVEEHYLGSSAESKGALQVRRGELLALIEFWANGHLDLSILPTAAKEPDVEHYRFNDESTLIETLNRCVDRIIASS